MGEGIISVQNDYSHDYKFHSSKQGLHCELKLCAPDGTMTVCILVVSVVLRGGKAGLPSLQACSWWEFIPDEIFIKPLK